MTKKSNHEADISNANKGTSGQNKTHKANQDNRANQLNPTWKRSRKKQ